VTPERKEDIRNANELETPHEHYTPLVAELLAALDDAEKGAARKTVELGTELLFAREVVEAARAWRDARNPAISTPWARRQRMRRLPIAQMKLSEALERYDEGTKKGDG
jgi:hypothetical protein